MVKGFLAAFLLRQLAGLAKDLPDISSNLYTCKMFDA
jgi:hypothetical protein